MNSNSSISQSLKLLMNSTRQFPTLPLHLSLQQWSHRNILIWMKKKMLAWDICSSIYIIVCISVLIRILLWMKNYCNTHAEIYILLISQLTCLHHIVPYYFKNSHNIISVLYCICLSCWYECYLALYLYLWIIFHLLKIVVLNKMKDSTKGGANWTHYKLK